MKVIITGPSQGGSLSLVEDAVRFSGYEVTEVVTEGDIAAERYAADRRIKLTRRADLARNRQIAKYADALIAVWDGRSTRTKDIINTARGHGLLVSIHRMEVQDG
jgi:hypothetical protein